MTYSSNNILHIHFKIIFWFDAYICFEKNRTEIKLLHIHQVLVHATGATQKPESNKIQIITFQLISNIYMQYFRKRIRETSA